MLRPASPTNTQQVPKAHNSEPNKTINRVQTTKNHIPPNMQVANQSSEATITDRSIFITFGAMFVFSYLLQACDAQETSSAAPGTTETTGISGANWKGPLMLLGFASGFALLALIGWLIKKRCDKIPEGQIAQHFAPCQRLCSPCEKALSACASGCGAACGQCCDLAIQCMECSCTALLDKCCEPLCGECCSKFCKSLEKYEIQPEQWPECCTCCHPPYECCPKTQDHQERIELGKTRVTFSKETPTAYEYEALEMEYTTVSSPQATRHTTGESIESVIITQPKSADKKTEFTAIDMDVCAQTGIPIGDRHIRTKSTFLFGSRNPDLLSSQTQPGTSHGQTEHHKSWWRPTFQYESSSSSDESLTHKLHDA
ncbi:hypothetical protein [Kistimonas asteriae]|uniref:hypothetical protein n=1 Tax=Kistimonas asteriae TaxID=517724 RepID=UPI001BA76CC2|nr:hypothetical protein [Kistimonas asteriae]